jgi:hypothetical protein
MQPGCVDGGDQRRRIVNEIVTVGATALAAAMAAEIESRQRSVDLAQLRRDALVDLLHRLAIAEFARPFSAIGTQRPVAMTDV